MFNCFSVRTITSVTNSTCNINASLRWANLLVLLCQNADVLAYRKTFT